MIFFKKKTTVSLLRPSTRQNPIAQAELRAFIAAHPEQVLVVQKVSVPVKITKTKGGEVVHTVIVSPGGRVIFETVNTAKAGDIIDTRDTPGSRPERFCKNAKNAFYIIEGNLSLADLKPGETVKAHTVGSGAREAIVVTQDTYIETTWGATQLVAKGGLITFTETGEAVGNNNPWDLVVIENG